MGPTTTLRHEHEEICVVLNAADRKAHSFTNDRRIDGEWVRSFAEFSRRFTVGFHQAKEERLLFRRLREQAPGETLALISAMLAEHEGEQRRMNRLLDHLEEAESGDDAAVLLAAEQLSAYVCLFEAHIAQEHNVLFPLADRLLSEEDVLWLDRASDELELEELEAGERDRLRDLGRRLAGESVGAEC